MFISIIFKFKLLHRRDTVTYDRYRGQRVIAKLAVNVAKRQGIGCMGQVLAVMQVCEKYLANGKDVFEAFMDLEKACDTIDRHGMWQMLMELEKNC